MADFRLTLGANFQGDGRTTFRVWAKDRQKVEVVIDAPNGARAHVLERERGGYFVGTFRAEPGVRYRYRLDGGALFPDPCSRFQPEGPHGPSEIVDPGRFKWSDGDWRGPSPEGQVLYELHVGAFSARGTYEGVRERLGYLKELGVTTIELLPLNTFPGRFNWGYDGVGLFAPCAVYGSPDELRVLVNQAHRLGLGVILDAVYNHLGPDGNYLGQFSRAYFSDRYPKEWGDPLNLDGPDAQPVRDLVIQNAAYWISEFHFDGLRLDATQSVYDASPRHVLAELSGAARAAAKGRSILLVAENEPQDRRVIEPQDQGGHGIDLMWIDDFHHSARVALTGRAEAYLQDYAGTAQELVSCVLRSSLYQGQYYAWQKKPRGTPLGDLPAHKLVFFLQNHDQVANSIGGHRLTTLTDAGKLRAMTTLLLLSPQTPLLFMGQELGTARPFRYFVDHKLELMQAIVKGRAEFLSQFPSIRAAFEREAFPLEIGEPAFEASRLDFDDPAHAPWLALHKALLRLRREDPLFARQEGVAIDGAVLEPHAFVLRWSRAPMDARLLFVNLGRQLSLQALAEPLLAPIPGRKWMPILSSEDTRFGGGGAVFPDFTDRAVLPGHAALVLSSGGAS